MNREAVHRRHEQPPWDRLAPGSPSGRLVLHDRPGMARPDSQALNYVAEACVANLHFFLHNCFENREAARANPGRHCPSTAGALMNTSRSYRRESSTDFAPDNWPSTSAVDELGYVFEVYFHNILERIREAVRQAIVKISSTSNNFIILCHCSDALRTPPTKC